MALLIRQHYYYYILLLRLLLVIMVFWGLPGVLFSFVTFNGIGINRCFEPSEPLCITSGLKTNYSPSLRYSAE